MDTFLPPIEHPKGYLMKLLYALARKKYGKVLTPLKVYGARLPLAFGSFYGKISSLDNKLVLPKETQAMVREMVARINICLFCMDIGRWHATGTLVNVEKLNALPDYATSPLFLEKDKALLDYVCELTRDKQVKPETFSHLASFYPEREICEIVYLVASEHVYNITNLGLNIHSDMLCELKQRVSG